MTIHKTAVTSALLGALALAAFSGSAIAQESKSTPQPGQPAAAAAAPAPSAKAKLPTDTNYRGHKMEAKAAIKLPEAREIALKERAGTITDFELEREKGGSGHLVARRHDGVVSAGNSWKSFFQQFRCVSQRSTGL